MSREALVRAAYACVTLSVFALDQVSKALILRRLDQFSSVPVVPGLFHLTLVTNRGALFGLFHDLAEPYRSILFTTIPAIAILLILLFQFRTSIADVAAHSGLALILGGAIGNLLDRVRLGYVVDFFDVFVGPHHWPAFNVADSSICLGVACLVVDLIGSGWRQVRAPIPPEG